MKNMIKVHYILLFLFTGHNMLLAQSLIEPHQINQIKQTIKDHIKENFDLKRWDKKTWDESQVVLLGDTFHPDVGQYKKRTDLINLFEEMNSLTKKWEEIVVLYEFHDTSRVLMPEEYELHQETRGLCADVIVGHWDNEESIRDFMSYYASGIHTGLYSLLWGKMGEKIYIERNLSLIATLNSLLKSKNGKKMNIFVVAGSTHFYPLTNWVVGSKRTSVQSYLRENGVSYINLNTKISSPEVVKYYNKNSDQTNAFLRSKVSSMGPLQAHGDAQHLIEIIEKSGH